MNAALCILGAPQGSSSTRTRWSSRTAAAQLARGFAAKSYFGSVGAEALLSCFGRISITLRRAVGDGRQRIHWLGYKLQMELDLRFPAHRLIEAPHCFCTC